MPLLLCASLAIICPLCLCSGLCDGDDVVPMLGLVQLILLDSHAQIPF